MRVFIIHLSPKSRAKIIEIQRERMGDAYRLRDG